MGESVLVNLTKFLGVNMDDTNMQIGEACSMINWRITDDYKPQKREGYYQIYSGSGAIRGQWYGKLNGTYYHIFAQNGHIYQNGSTVVDLGTLVDDITNFFVFGTYLYILNGHEYYRWNGTGNIQIVEGTRPKILVTCDPATGSGTQLDSINVLNGKKSATYSPLADTIEFNILQKNNDSIDYVKVNGTTKALTTDYTVNASKDKVTFVTGSKPGAGTDTVEIGWTNGTGQRDIITSNRYFCIYGGSNDTRVFLYGNKNIRVWSDLAARVPSAEYFPPNNYSAIGSGEFDITQIEKQYDRQIIYLEKGAFYSVYDPISDVGVNYSVYPLNDKIGNIPKGQGQLIQNNPFTLYNGVYEWQSTSVRDERNAIYKSKRIQAELSMWDLSSVITFDYEERAEFWICNQKEVWIYNYRIDVWYKYVLQHKPTSFCIINGALVFSTDDGCFMKFDKSRYTDNGTKMPDKIELGFIGFGADWMQKFLSDGFITLKQMTRTGIKMSWETDRGQSDIPLEIHYNMLNFNDIDFNNFSFLVNYNPQPRKLDIKAKKFSIIKIILTNDSDSESAVIVNLTLPAIIGGTVD